MALTVRFMTMALLVLLVVSGGAGCAVMQVSVTNPLPQMTRIAVVPFLNLSSERAVDGRHFAELYFSELQKVPGFQVLPVGVTEVASPRIAAQFGQSRRSGAIG